MNVTTADIYDHHHSRLQVCELQFRNFGGRRRFFGQCATVRTYESHLPVLNVLESAGEGRILIVDAGGSLRVGVMGDRIAAIAMANNWIGVIIHGAIRDSYAINTLDFGVKALGSTARRGWDHMEGSRNEDVYFGGVQIKPDQWIYADEDSVLVSPQKLDLDVISAGAGLVDAYR